jgi:hypothetical protein
LLTKEDAEILHPQFLCFPTTERWGQAMQEERTPKMMVEFEQVVIEVQLAL